MGILILIKMPSKQEAKYTKVLTEAQPYFDKLNGEISSKEILTPEEYEQYIKALMTYEKKCWHRRK
ncbi:hypothetical protein GCM10020331_094290 [Ectobacillus funiculus]